MLKNISAYNPSGHRACPVGVLVSNANLHLVSFRPTHLSKDNLFKTLNLSNTLIQILDAQLPRHPIRIDTCPSTPHQVDLPWLTTFTEHTN